MKIKITELEDMCVAVLKAKGLSEDQAKQVFDEYLDGELRGRECHGFQAFPKFGAKLVEMESKPEIIREEDNLFYIDGKKNLGQLVCNEYVPKLIQKTKKKHIAMMGIKNMHSYLMPGTYARMAAKNDVVGFIFNYGGWHRIAPHGSIDPFFGTNPIAIGIPGKDFPIVIDMATSKIAMMKIRLAEKLGQKIPEGRAVNKGGKSTTNPTEAMDGALFPFGEHKGSALALAVEILTKTMFNIDIHDETKANRGFFFAFYDPSVYQPIEKFKENVSELVLEIKESRKAEGVAEIFLPGEHSEKTKQENIKKKYIDIDERIINDIKELIKKE